MQAHPFASFHRNGSSQSKAPRNYKFEEDDAKENSNQFLNSKLSLSEQRAAEEELNYYNPELVRKQREELTKRQQEQNRSREQEEFHQYNESVRRSPQQHQNHQNYQNHQNQQSHYDTTPSVSQNGNGISPSGRTTGVSPDASFFGVHQAYQHQTSPPLQHQHQNQQQQQQFNNYGHHGANFRPHTGHFNTRQPYHQPQQPQHFHNHHNPHSHAAYQHLPAHTKKESQETKEQKKLMNQLALKSKEKQALSSQQQQIAHRQALQQHHPVYYSFLCLYELVFQNFISRRLSSILYSSFVLPLTWLWQAAVFVARTLRGEKKINCWFCMFDDVVMLPSLASLFSEVKFTCRKCGQYNGFTADGDYDIPIPAMTNEKYNRKNITPRGRKQSPRKTASELIADIGDSHQPTLCFLCTKNQTILLNARKNFKAQNEKHRDEEFQVYMEKQELYYPYCPRCENLINKELDRQKKALQMSSLRQRVTATSSITPAEFYIQQKYNGKMENFIRFCSCGIWLFLFFVMSFLIVWDLMTSNFSPLASSVLNDWKVYYDARFRLHLPVFIGFGCLCNVFSLLLMNKQNILKIDTQSACFSFVLLALQCIAFYKNSFNQYNDGFYANLESNIFPEDFEFQFKRWSYPSASIATTIPNSSLHSVSSSQFLFMTFSDDLYFISILTFLTLIMSIYFQLRCITILRSSKSLREVYNPRQQRYPPSSAPNSQRRPFPPNSNNSYQNNLHEYDNHNSTRNYGVADSGVHGYGGSSSSLFSSLTSWIRDENQSHTSEHHRRSSQSWRQEGMGRKSNSINNNNSSRNDNDNQTKLSPAMSSSSEGRSYTSSHQSVSTAAAVSPQSQFVAEPSLLFGSLGISDNNKVIDNTKIISNNNDSSRRFHHPPVKETWSSMFPSSTTADDDQTSTTATDKALASFATSFTEGSSNLSFMCSKSPACSTSSSSSTYPLTHDTAVNQSQDEYQKQQQSNKKNLHIQQSNPKYQLRPSLFGKDVVPDIKLTPFESQFNSISIKEEVPPLPQKMKEAALCFVTGLHSFFLSTSSFVKAIVLVTFLSIWKMISFAFTSASQNLQMTYEKLSEKDTNSKPSSASGSGNVSLLSSLKLSPISLTTPLSNNNNDNSNPIKGMGSRTGRRQWSKDQWELDQKRNQQASGGELRMGVVISCVLCVVIFFSSLIYFLMTFNVTSMVLGLVLSPSPINSTISPNSDL